MTLPETPNQVGEEFADGLRKSSGYKETQEMIEKEGITEAALNKTPPVGLNLRLLAEMPIMTQLKQEFKGQPINAAIFGIAIADGVADFWRFLQTGLNTQWKELQILDIDSVILKEVSEKAKALNLPGVITKEVDARQSQIEPDSLDMVLMDHLGNCCPPDIDRVIQRETHRILKPGGIAIVNITTSELLNLSPERKGLPFNHVRDIMGDDGIDALHMEIYDLAQLNRKFKVDLDFTLRGHLLAIEKECPGSVVIFGENEAGHGEWFRPLADHLQQWKSPWWQPNFEILEMRSREGNDSHNPPLRCFRHNIVLRKL
jgi:SAM-dependent methyltransferase